MFTGISKKICGAFLLTGAVLLLNAKEPWAYFKREVKILMPSVAKFQSTAKGVCTLLDAKGQKTGTLLLELIPDEKRKMGYAGTIEVAVLLDRSGKIAGVLVGKNQETPGFLRRVRNKGFFASWNGKTLKDAAKTKVDAVTGATYSSNAIKAGVQQLLKDHGNVKVDTVQNSSADTASEIKALERKAAMHRKIIAASEKLYKQLRERKSEELQLRLIALLEGNEKAAAFAESKKMIFFNHPRRRGEKTVVSPAQKLAQQYKKSRSKEDLEALKKAVLEEIEGLTERIVPHNREHAKALKAVQKRLLMLKKNQGR